MAPEDSRTIKVYLTDRSITKNYPSNSDAICAGLTLCAEMAESHMSAVNMYPSPAVPEGALLKSLDPDEHGIALRLFVERRPDTRDKRGHGRAKSTSSINKSSPKTAPDTAPPAPDLDEVLKTMEKKILMKTEASLAKATKSLNKTISSLKDENNQLKREISNHEKDISKLNSDLQDSKDEITILKEDNTSLQGKVGILQKENKRLLFQATEHASIIEEFERLISVVRPIHIRSLLDMARDKASRACGFSSWEDWQAGRDESQMLALFQQQPAAYLTDADRQGLVLKIGFRGFRRNGNAAAHCAKREEIETAISQLEYEGQRLTMTRILNYVYGL